MRRSASASPSIRRRRSSRSPIPPSAKDVAWIEDVAAVFAPEASLTELTEDYVAKNPAADRKQVGKVLQRLGKIINNHVGLIELAEDLDIETVTEIFIRVNSAGHRALAG